MKRHLNKQEKRYKRIQAIRDTYYNSIGYVVFKSLIRRNNKINFITHRIH